MEPEFKREKREKSKRKSLERWEKNKKDPNVQPQPSYVLFFRSLVPRLVQRCQENCDINLKPSDNEDYLVVKSHDSTTFTVNGEKTTRSGPQYVHLNKVCLRNMHT